MADSLNNTFVQLTEIAKEKEMLAENMAHEIRNPLTTIAGFSEYLFNANISDENRLIALGFSCGSYGADGIMGRDTTQAVKNFQRSRNIEIDGYVGVDTSRKLVE